MDRLKGKVAIITGAAGGIGASSAALFADEGARVVAVDIDAEGGEAVTAEIRSKGGDAWFVRTDVREEASVANAVAFAVERFGRLDVLFNVAGGSAVNDAPVHEVDMDLWNRTLSVDLLGTFLFCRHAVRVMMPQRSGSIVNTSSWAGLKGFHKHVYVAAKGGILSLTRAMAGDYAEHGIRVNVVCPGSVRSKRNIARYGALTGTEDARAVERARVAKRYPFSSGDPVDIANIGLFLASDESRMITGATVAADGGRSAY